MATVSMIVPVYNVEAHLRKCLESCCNQALPDVEVIVVNDASPDHSAAIMREYELRFPERVRCIYLSENIRQGGARNRGLDIAKGEYITFVDGDDYLDPSFCEVFYKNAHYSQAEIVYGHFQNITQTGTMLSTPRPHAIAALSKEQNVNLINVSPVALLIKRETLRRKDMRFPENIFCEDIPTSILWLLNADKISFVDTALYYRTIRPGSVTQHSNLWSQQCCLLALEHLIEKIEKMNLYIQYKDVIDVYILRNMLFAIKNVYQYHPCDFQDFCAYANRILQRVKPEWVSNCSIRRYLSPSMLQFLRYIASGRSLDGSAGYFERLYIDSQSLYDGFRDELFRLLTWLKQEGCTRIAVWGAGENGLPLIQTLSRMGIDFHVTDKSERILGTVLSTGQTVLSFADIADKTDAILVTTHDYFKEIMGEARLYGKFIIFNLYLYIKTGLAPQGVYALYDNAGDFDYHTRI